MNSPCIAATERCWHPPRVGLLVAWQANSGGSRHPQAGSLLEGLCTRHLETFHIDLRKYAKYESHRPAQSLFAGSILQLSYPKHDVSYPRMMIKHVGNTFESLIAVVIYVVGRVNMVVVFL